MRYPDALIEEVTKIATDLDPKKLPSIEGYLTEENVESGWILKDAGDEIRLYRWSSMSRDLRLANSVPKSMGSEKMLIKKLMSLMKST